MKTHLTVEQNEPRIFKTFAVWNTILGSSVLSMPWGIQKAGLLGGPMLMVLMGILCLYTAHRILKVHSYYSGKQEHMDVSELCKMLLGNHVAIISRIISMVVLVGATVVYWVLMSNFLYNSVGYFHDSIYDLFEKDLVHYNVTGSEVLCPRFQPVLQSNATIAQLENTTQSSPVMADFSNQTSEKYGKIGDPSFYEKFWKLHGTVPILLAALVFPLVNFRSATFFTKFNSLGTLSVIYLIIFVVTKAFQWGIHINVPSNNEAFHTMPRATIDATELTQTITPLFLPSFPALSGMLALSFFIHNIVVNIMKNNRQQENNSRDLSIAFVLVTATYLIIGVVFYACFPLNKACIEDAFLNNFPTWDAMTVSARLFLFFQLMTVFPLLSYMVRVQLFSAIPFLRPKTQFHHVTSFAKVTTAPSTTAPAKMLYIICINVVLIIICILFAIFLPRIGTIIRFTGAMSGFVYVFTIPCLLHMATQKQMSSEVGFFNTGMSLTSILMHLMIPALAFANLVAQFLISDS